MLTGAGVRAEPSPRSPRGWLRGGGGREAGSLGHAEGAGRAAQQRGGAPPTRVIFLLPGGARVPGPRTAARRGEGSGRRGRGRIPGTASGARRTSERTARRRPSAGDPRSAGRGLAGGWRGAGRGPDGGPRSRAPRGRRGRAQAPAGTAWRGLLRRRERKPELGSRWTRRGPSPDFGGHFQVPVSSGRVKTRQGAWSGSPATGGHGGGRGGVGEASALPTLLRAQLGRTFPLGP